MTQIEDDRCPLHGHVLELVHDYDGDESGTWPVQWFQCRATYPPHTYRAEPNGSGDYYPVDEDGD